MTIKKGDMVIWRQGKSRVGRRHMPLGIANCEVLDFGETAEGEPAVALRLPPIFNSEQVNALVSDLEKD